MNRSYCLTMLCGVCLAGILVGILYALAPRPEPARQVVVSTVGILPATVDVPNRMPDDLALVAAEHRVGCWRPDDPLSTSNGHRPIPVGNLDYMTYEAMARMDEETDWITLVGIWCKPTVTGRDGDGFLVHIDRKRTSKPPKRKPVGADCMFVPEERGRASKIEPGSPVAVLGLWRGRRYGIPFLTFCRLAQKQPQPAPPRRQKGG